MLLALLYSPSAPSTGAYSAFQSNAFQNNAFQILVSESPPVVEEIAGDSTRHSHELYERRQKELKAKQDLIIAKKLEAQALLVRQAEEALKEQNKQTARQIVAMREAKVRLEQEIQDELRLLKALEEQMRITRNNNALLALVLSCPFLTIH